MIFLAKEHLINSHYTWTEAVTSSMFAGDPGRRLFDRFNGHQMLYIINFFGSSIGKLTIAEGQKLEDLIFNQMPPEVKSEMAVFNWLRGIYLYHAH